MSNLAIAWLETSFVLGNVPLVAWLSHPYQFLARWHGEWLGQDT